MTEKQTQLLDAIRAGAKLTPNGWQQINVTYGPRDPRNYVAMEGTLYALRRRGLITTGPDGVQAV